MIDTLKGTRVVEFTHAVLGPTCGLVLADLGAEVIRVEPPGGDPTRRLKGFGMGYYSFFNRNKKSLALDLKDEAGLEIVKKLVAGSDILIENFGPSTMDRLGLGFEQVSRFNERLIYVSLKGFLPGPYENRTALDEVVQMMSGLAYMTGPPGQPLRAGASVIDITAGLYGALAALAALRERDGSGRGQLVRGALFETAAFLMGQHMAYGAVSGAPVPPMPARVSAWAVYHQFDTAGGGRVFVGVTSDKQWVRFCEIFEKPDWLLDERLSTNHGRIDARGWLLPALRELFSAMEQDEILERCARAGLPFSPIARPEDLFTDPQLGANLLPVRLSNGEKTTLPAQPFEMDGRKTGLYAQPPEIGQHSEEILASLGVSREQIDALLEKGVLAGAAG